MPESSCYALAHEILNRCLAGDAWPAGQLRLLLERATAEDSDLAREGSAALFGVIAEGLADRFEARLADEYARIFSRAIAAAEPEFDAADLEARYRRVRRVRPLEAQADGVQSVYVLSRVTLGADVAITSVILDAARRRFPDAQIILAGERKSWELFAGDKRLTWLPVHYRRNGTLRERLMAGRELVAATAGQGSIVLDPDSRLTQLGLLPLAADENYFLFDSRSYGGDGEESLTVLAQRWVREVLSVGQAAPYVAPLAGGGPVEGPYVVVNLGVGENLAKRVADPFEEELLRAVARKGHLVLVDVGAGGEEEARARGAIARSGASESRVRAWNGSFAALAATIARSALYIGYDSAGQHAAAACGTPLISVFAGFSSPRTFARWCPTGPGPKRVIRVDEPNPAAVLERTKSAIDALMAG